MPILRKKQDFNFCQLIPEFSSKAFGLIKKSEAAKKQP